MSAGPNGHSDERCLVFEANMDAALRRYYKRTGAELAVTDMPFDELLTAEDDGLDGEVGAYEMRQRVTAIRGLFRYLLSEGQHPLKIMKRLFAAGRAMEIAPFSELTMGEAGMMFSEGKAAHSWRCKVLSGDIKLAGMKGVRLPGQKTPAASDSYRKTAKRTCNRRKKQRTRRRGKPLPD